MSKRDGCRQDCCRVPFEGVCAKQRGCSCHWQEQALAREVRNANTNRALPHPTREAVPLVRGTITVHGR